MVPTTQLYNCSEKFLHNINLGGREGTESIISMCVSELGTGRIWLSILVSKVLVSHYNRLRDFGVGAENRLELPKCIGVAVLETV
jgi:hypothetical protein